MTQQSTTATETSGSEALLHRIRSLAQRPSALRVGDLIDRYMAQYAGRDQSRSHRLRVWKQLLGELTLEELDADIIQAARSEIAARPAVTYQGKDVDGRKIFRAKAKTKTKTPATINRHIVALSAVFTWAQEQRLTPKAWVHPCRGIRRLTEAPGRVRYLSQAEREALLASCRTSQYPRLYALVLTALLTGARKGELLNLRWSDVDLAQGTATLGRTKNGDRRTLVLMPQVIEALAPLASTDLARFVFGSPRSKYKSPAAIDTAWLHAVDRAGVQNFRFHDLRHSCASYLAQAGTPLNVIAEVLGHRKLDMTRRYAHLTIQTTAGAMRLALSEIAK